MMDKQKNIKKTDQFNDLNIVKSKILSISLILILTFLTYYLLPEKFNTFGGILNGSIPIFTIFFSGYVFQYGLKKVISKIIFTILVLFALFYLSLYGIMSQL